MHITQTKFLQIQAELQNAGFKLFPNQNIRGSNFAWIKNKEDYDVALLCYSTETSRYNNFITYWCSFNNQLHRSEFEVDDQQMTMEKFEQMCDQMSDILRKNPEIPKEFKPMNEKPVDSPIPTLYQDDKIEYSVVQLEDRLEITDIKLLSKDKPVLLIIPELEGSNRNYEKHIVKEPSVWYQLTPIEIPIGSTIEVLELSQAEYRISDIWTLTPMESQMIVFYSKEKILGEDAIELHGIELVTSHLLGVYVRSEKNGKIEIDDCLSVFNNGVRYRVIYSSYNSEIVISNRLISKSVTLNVNLKNLL